MPPPRCSDVGTISVLRSSGTSPHFRITLASPKSLRDGSFGPREGDRAHDAGLAGQRLGTPHGGVGGNAFRLAGCNSIVENRPALVGSEPDGHLLAIDGVVLGERGERHQAAALRIEPALPVRALATGRWSCRHRALSSAAAGSRLACPLLPASWWRPQNPPRPQRAITSSRPRGIVRKILGTKGRSPVRSFAGMTPNSR